MDLWEEVGMAAGEVYSTLSLSDTAMTVVAIKKKTKLDLEMTHLGIGWLLREEKVNLVKAGKSRKVKIK